MSNSDFHETLNDVAIVGMSGRFPGAPNLEAFWRNLSGGVESVTFFSNEELQAAGVEPAILQHPNYVKARAILDDVDLFDASFFGFNPREAEITDPQHRLLLECAWEALENAGYGSGDLKARAGVFVGTSWSSYLLNIYPHLSAADLFDSFRMLLGNDKDHLPTWISYKLNLKGLSVNVQTACSTSLVAVHLACQSLLTYQCEMALAGGVTIGVPQKSGYIYEEGGISSPDGHCRVFDAKAQGSVTGSGLGIVVLKRLGDALADRDTIYAVIKGSAANNDGASKISYTAPSIDGQAEVIAMAHAIAGVGPESITMIEAHGSGTSLGDPIEVAALTQAFGSSPVKAKRVALGSVKSNVGHTGAAAGVAGLIKATLALTHKLIPPSLHFEQPNTQIDFKNSPFYVNTELTEWNSNGEPRRAGVSSFGIGGTNAHVILQEAPVRESSAGSRDSQLLLVSARSAAALDTLTDNLSAHLRQDPEQNLADVAHTLMVGRKAFPHRRMLLCRDTEDAAKALETRETRRVLSGVTPTQKRRVAFMFPGLGDQYVNMALGLYRTESKFREQFDLCCELLQPHLNEDLRTVIYPQGTDAAKDVTATSSAPPQGLDLRKLLFPGNDEPDAATRRLNQTHLTQPAVFVIEYALAQLWLDWGVRPEAMIGYSVGEYVAACLAGVITLEDALRLIAQRARMIGELPAGAMLGVPVPEEEVRALLTGELSIAAINGPSMCVVSGPPAAVDELAQELNRREIISRSVQTSHAFHSPAMAPIASEFTALVASLKLQPPRIPYISNVTGTWITDKEATDPNYWTRHLLETVRFASGVQELWRDDGRVLLEIGPGQTLSSLVLQQTDFNQNKDRAVLPSIRPAYDRQSDTAFLLNTVGRLWLAGVTLDWSRFYADEQRYRVPLPSYPFERQRYWIDGKSQKFATVDTSSTNAGGTKPDVADWLYLPSWKLSVPPSLSLATDAGVENHWLILADSEGLGEKLTTRLQLEGQQTISVFSGREFKRISDRVYTINPQKLEDYASLTNELASLDQLPTRILHLWGVTSAKAVQPDGSERFAAAQDQGFNSLLYLTQAVGEKQNSREIHIAVVANGIYQVTGDESLQPEKATVLVPGMFISRAMSHVTCRHIDIVLPLPGSSSEQRLLDQLIAETSPRSAGETIAYRRDHRWVLDYQPVQAEVGSAARLRTGGVFLITGGMTGVGPELAEYLARTAQARLVLVEENNFPPPAEWEQWLVTHSGDDVVSEKIKRIQKLQASGTQIEILNADVTSEAEMRSAITAIYERFGALHGVVHTVETVGSTTASRNVESAAHSNAKVLSTYVLDQVLAGREVDFCLLVSSLAAILGNTASMPQAAANIFLDAFARSRNSDDSAVRWASISWDEEADSTATATVWDRFFSLSSVKQIVVSSRDLKSALERAVKASDGDGEVKATAQASGRILHARPNIGVSYVAPESATEHAIVEIWQRLLGIDSIGVHDSFFELGGNSLVCIQLAARLRDTFQINIPLTAVFELTTISEQAIAVEDILLSEIEELDELDAEQFSAGV